MTVARGLNMIDAGGFARIIQSGEPDFVEVKAYMHLGRSRARLSRDSMPEHGEILEFSARLAEALGYQQADDVPLSRVALLSSGKVPKAIPV